jgi:hypothetical protein
MRRYLVARTLALVVGLAGCASSTTTRDGAVLTEPLAPRFAASGPNAEDHSRDAWIS